MSTEHDAFQLYKIYRAVKLHFESDTYNYGVYNGKLGIKLQQFQKAKERSFFYRLADVIRPEEGVGFMVSLCSTGSLKFIGDLNFEKAKETYNKWFSRMQTMRRTFKNDIRHLAQLANADQWVAIPEDGTYPLICQEEMQGNISLESTVIVGKMIDVLPDLEANETFFFPGYKRRLVKYSAFLNPDIREFARIAKNELREAGHQVL